MVRCVRRLFAALFLLGTPATLVAQSSVSDGEYLALGRKLYDWFMSAEADSLLAYVNAGVRENAGGNDGVQRMVADFLDRSGVEQELLVEKMTLRRGSPQYWRESRYTSYTDEPIVFRWVFDNEGKIIGIGTGPKSSTPEPD